MLHPESTGTRVLPSSFGGLRRPFARSSILAQLTARATIIEAPGRTFLPGHFLKDGALQCKKSGLVGTQRETTLGSCLRMVHGALLIISPLARCLNTRQGTSHTTGQ